MTEKTIKDDNKETKLKGIVAGVIGNIYTPLTGMMYQGGPEFRINSKNITLLSRSAITGLNFSTVYIREDTDEIRVRTGVLRKRDIILKSSRLTSFEKRLFGLARKDPKPSSEDISRELSDILESLSRDISGHQLEYDVVKTQRIFHNGPIPTDGRMGWR